MVWKERLVFVLLWYHLTPTHASISEALLDYLGSYLPPCVINSGTLLYWFVSAFSRALHIKLKVVIMLAQLAQYYLLRQAQPQLHLKLSLLGWDSINLTKSSTHQPNNPPAHPPTYPEKNGDSQLNQSKLSADSWFLLLATFYLLPGICYLMLTTWYL